MGKSNQAISLISLIVTIIVIIILATITIFNGLNTPAQAEFAEFTTEISDFVLVLQKEYLEKFGEYARLGDNRTKSQVYYELATGVDVGENGEPSETATVGGLGFDIFPKELVGNEYYEILSDIKIGEYETGKKYYDKKEKHYITDEGEFFVLPGYPLKDGDTNKWWINENKYYVSDTPIYNPLNIVIKNIRVSSDTNGEQIASKDIEMGTELFINFDLVDGEEVVESTPDTPYKITKNGRYNFSIQSTSGKTMDYTVAVTNFDVPTIAECGFEVGDYVKYEGDKDNSYTLYKENTGDETTDGTIFTPTAKTWRVWKKKSNGDVVIMPTAPQHSFALYGATGYRNSLDIMEGICDIYANKYVGVTNDDVRCLTVKDLEDTKVTSNALSAKESSAEYGKTNLELNGNNGYTTGTFYVAEDGLTPLKTPRIASEDNPIKVTYTRYSVGPSWNKINSSKFPTATYGTLIGSSYSWLASPCIICQPNRADYYIQYVRSAIIGAQYLGTTDGDVYGLGSGVRPLVTLKASTPVNSGNGKTASTGWEI